MRTTARCTWRVWRAARCRRTSCRRSAGVGALAAGAALGRAGALGVRTATDRSGGGVSPGAATGPGRTGWATEGADAWTGAGTGTAVESGGSGLLTCGAEGSGVLPATGRSSALAPGTTATVPARTASAVSLRQSLFTCTSPCCGSSPLGGKGKRDAPCWARTSDPQLVELVLSQLS
jgi:hypothetical protein